jgi:hypothetical protein
LFSTFGYQSYLPNYDVLVELLLFRYSYVKSLWKY